MATPSPRKRVTLSQVAEQAGVSTMTASYAYNRPSRVSEESRRKVFEAARLLGYTGPDPSARSLRGGSTGAVGVVLGEHLAYAFEDPQAAAFLAGVADVCASRGFALTVLPVTDVAKDAGRLRAAAVDGFVFWTTEDGAPIIDAAVSTRRPVVVHGGPASPGADLVGIDNRSAARAAALAAFAGARRPAVVSFPLTPARTASTSPGVDADTATLPVTRDRLLGFRDAAAELGIDWSGVRVVVCSANDADEARATVGGLLGGQEAPDAIAAMSDELAAGVIRAAARHGVEVPRDLAVTGWDDAAVAAELGITTIAQSLREQGSACARSVLDGVGTDLSRQWSLVERSSTRRP